jgi:hypothetical protein
MIQVGASGGVLDLVPMSSSTITKAMYSQLAADADTRPSVETVDDEAGGVAVPCLIALDALGVGQECRPCAFDGPIGVELYLAVFQLWFLPHNQRCLATWG